jgi:hypothetical protein
MNTLQDHPEGQFERIAPLLDEAINQLGASDRAAIVLRFFEHRDLRAVGVALGSNEDAAQKRVSRAVEKLRCHFARRGIVASSTVIASVIAAHAVHAAPAGLASTVTTASLAGAAGSSSFGLASTLIKTMLVKKTTLIAAAVILTTTIVSITAVQTKHARADVPVTAESLREGLVLDMTFDQDEAGSGVIMDSSGKARGGKITDHSGQGNHGVAAGVRWTADGQRGGAYEFTAEGDEIVISNNKSLNPKQLTLAAWIKTSYTDDKWRRIFDKSWDQGYDLTMGGDWHGLSYRGQVGIEIGPKLKFIRSGIVVADGQWHHVAGTFDGNEEIVYVDGRPMGSPVPWKKPVPSNSFNLTIGSNRSTPSEESGLSFIGLIDEPMMWNRALSANEVAFLYQSQQ